MAKRNEELEADKTRLSEKVGRLSKRLRTLEQNTGSQPQPSSSAETSSLHRLEVCGSAVSVSLQRTINKQWSLGHWNSPRCQIMRRLLMIFLVLLMNIPVRKIPKAMSTYDIVSRFFFYRKRYLRFVKVVASNMKLELRREYPP
jgi:hypothetical protein